MRNLGKRWHKKYSTDHWLSLDEMDRALQMLYNYWNHRLKVERR